MDDQVVVKKTFGSRFKNSISGVLVGLLLIIIGIVMLACNEKNALKNKKDAIELRKNYVEVVSDQVDTENNGNLVVTSGKLVWSPSNATDKIFGVTYNTPVLERKVEIYEWVEESTETNDSTTYSYSKSWNNSIVNSNNFHKKEGHTNPTAMPYENDEVTADTLTIGAYSLTSIFVGKLNAGEDLLDLSAATVPVGYRVDGNYITNSADLSNPQVGDVRISFKYGDYKDVTVMGKLNGSRIESYKTKKGSSITSMMHGILSGDEVITSIENANNAMKWIMRILGTILIIIGLNALAGPITNLTSYVPILGSIFNGAVGLVMFILGLAISLVVIAISWFVVRPILSILLIAVVVGLVYLLKRFKKDTKQAK